MRYTTTADRLRGAVRPAPGHGVAAGLMVAAAGVIVAAALVGATDAAAVVECAPVLVSEMGDVDALRAAGWRGDPRDGMEALYPPGCLTAP